MPNPYVTLIRKGRKNRSVPVMDKTVDHLRTYLEEFHPNLTEAPLFYNRLDVKPHQLSTDSISLILKTAAKKARTSCPEVPDIIHCHLMRKTKTMGLYRNRVSPPIIMQLLSHDSMSTTSGFYEFSTLEMMTEAMNKTTPAFEDS